MCKYCFDYTLQALQIINRRLDELEASCRAQDSMKEAITKVQNQVHRLQERIEELSANDGYQSLLKSAIQADLEKVQGLAVKLNKSVNQLQEISSSLQSSVDQLDADNEDVDDATTGGTEQVLTAANETASGMEEDATDDIKVPAADEEKVVNEEQAQTPNSSTISLHGKQVAMTWDEFSLRVIEYVSEEYRNVDQWPIGRTKQFQQLVQKMANKTRAKIAEILEKDISDVPTDASQLTPYLGQLSHSHTISPSQMQQLKKAIANIRFDYARGLIQAFNWSEADFGMDREQFCSYFNTCVNGN